MANKFYNLIKSISYRIGIPIYLLAGLFILLLIFLAFDWLVSVPMRAGKIDSYILFSMSEVSRFYYAKVAYFNPYVLLNPNAKPLYVLISSIFLAIFPLGIFSLKMLNSILSVIILFVLYKLEKKIGIEEPWAVIALIFTVTFPLFFLASIASLSEILFCCMLIIAIYLVFSKKYLLSSILVSLLPLIRQEGAVYIAVWVFFLFSAKKRSYSWMLPFPLLIWILLNHFLLGHSFVYPFFVSIDLPGPTPNAEVMLLPEFINLASLILFHPVLFLFPLGLILRLSGRKYLPITAPLVTHCFFLILAATMQFLLVRKISCEFRYIVMLVPLMAIMSVSALEKLFFNLSEKAKELVGIILLIVLTFMLFGKISALQKSPHVMDNRLTEKQERSINEAANWLNDFLAASGIRNIFYPGDLTTDRIIRRIKFYLQGNITMYPVRDHGEVYDPVTFKLIFREIKDYPRQGIILMLDPAMERALLSIPEENLIKSFPAVPIYFYRKQSNKHD